MFFYGICIGIKENNTLKDINTERNDDIMYTQEDLEEYRNDIIKRCEEEYITTTERDILLNQYQKPSDLEIEK